MEQRERDENMYREKEDRRVKRGVEGGMCMNTEGAREIDGGERGDSERHQSGRMSKSHEKEETPGGGEVNMVWEELNLTKYLALKPGICVTKPTKWWIMGEVNLTSASLAM